MPIFTDYNFRLCGHDYKHIFTCFTTSTRPDVVTATAAWRLGVWGKCFTMGPKLQPLLRSYVTGDAHTYYVHIVAITAICYSQPVLSMYVFVRLSYS